MQEVEVKARTARAAREHPDARTRPTRCSESAARARAAFGDRTIWHVNATAHGGGVAEMLQTLLAYGRGAQHREPVAGARRRAGVLRHHEAPAQPLARRSGRRRSARRRTNTPATSGSSAANLAEMLPMVGARDIVLLHDPQTAGMVDGLRATGVRVVWRCHVGRDTRNDETDEAWAFLRPYIERADAFVFSREEYAPEWVDRQRLVVIPPSIDPFSAKNRELDRANGRARSWPPRAWSAARDPDGPVSLRAPRRLRGQRPAPHGPHRRRAAAAPGRAAHRPGEPVGPAQGHGRRAHRLRPDGR